MLCSLVLTGCGQSQTWQQPLPESTACYAEYATTHEGPGTLLEYGTEWLNTEGEVVEREDHYVLDQEVHSARQMWVWADGLMMQLYQDGEDDGVFEFVHEWTYDGAGRETEYTREYEESLTLHT